jgi:hypothetical protein
MLGWLIVGIGFHDSTVIFLADLCSQRSAHVFDDSGSVDRLVQYENTELIIEVTSVTSRNFVKRLCYALGQLCHYDYLRTKQNDTQRRRVIAVAAHLLLNSWCVPLVKDYRDMDLVSLKG